MAARIALEQKLRLAEDQVRLAKDEAESERDAAQLKLREKTAQLKAEQGVCLLVCLCACVYVCLYVCVFALYTRMHA